MCLMPPRQVCAWHMVLGTAKVMPPLATPPAELHFWLHTRYIGLRKWMLQILDTPSQPPQGWKSTLKDCSRESNLTEL